MGDKGRKIALGLGLLSVTSTLSPLLPVGGTAPEGWAAQSSAEGGGTVLPLGLEEPGRQVSDPGLGPHLPLTGGDPGAQGSPASSLGVTCLAGPAGQRWTERARPCARPAGPRRAGNLEPLPALLSWRRRLARATHPTTPSLGLG